MATVKMVFHRNCLNEPLSSSSGASRRTMGQLPSSRSSSIGVTVEVVTEGIIDSKVMVRLSLDFDHSGTAGFAISLVKLVENRQKLKERLPELKNWKIAAVIVVIEQLLTQQVLRD